MIPFAHCSPPRHSGYEHQILERMRMEKKNPTEAAFAMGLMSAGHLGQLKAAEIIFHDRHRLGFPPKEKVYISVSGRFDGIDF